MWSKDVSVSGVGQGKTGWRLQKGNRKSNKPELKLRSADKHLWIHNTKEKRRRNINTSTLNIGPPLLTVAEGYTRHATPSSANTLYLREHSRIQASK